MYFQTRRVTIEAFQWFKNGDHPEDFKDVACKTITGRPPNQKDFLVEGKVVRYWRRPDIVGTTKCTHCGKTMHEHGWIETLEGGHIVCPGDWIITGLKKEKYPCKPDIFDMKYVVVHEHSQDEDVRALKIAKKYGSPMSRGPLLSEPAEIRGALMCLYELVTKMRHPKRKDDDQEIFR